MPWWQEPTYHEFHIYPRPLSVFPMLLISFYCVSVVCPLATVCWRLECQTATSRIWPSVQMTVQHGTIDPHQCYNLHMTASSCPWGHIVLLVHWLLYINATFQDTEDKTCIYNRPGFCDQWTASCESSNLTVHCTICSKHILIKCKFFNTTYILNNIFRPQNPLRK